MKKSSLLISGSILFFSLLASPVKSQENQGYEKTLELGSSIGYGDYPNYTFNFSTVQGLRFSEHLFAGIGTGLSYSDQFYVVLSHNKSIKFRDDALFIPVFGQVKVNFSTQEWSPYVSLNAGYIFDITQELGDASGLLLQPNVGVSYRLNKQIRGFFQAGLRFHRYKYGEGLYEIYYIYIPGKVYPTDTYNNVKDHYRFFQAVDIKVGIQF